MTWNPFRKKFPAVKPIGPVDGARAKAFLKDRITFDIDSFLATQSAHELFNTPLGRSAECLSVNQVAEFVEIRRLSGAIGQHAVSCTECREQVRAYEKLKNTHWAANDIEIFARDRIRIPEGGSLYLVLLNRGESGALEQIRPESVIVGGAIVASGCEIRPSAHTYGASEAVELHFSRFTVNAPSDVTEVCDWVSVEAETSGGKLRKRELVRVVREERPAYA